MSEEQANNSEHPDNSSTMQENCVDTIVSSSDAVVGSSDIPKEVLGEDIADTDTKACDLELKTSENHLNDMKTEQSPVKASRELKSILALSKEANLDVNIAYKRKSMETGKAEPITKHRNSTELNSDGTKRSMRSQNPEFIVKNQKFLSMLTENDADWQNLSDSEEHKKVKDKDGSNKTTKRKKDNLTEVSVGGTTEDFGRKNRKSLKVSAGMSKGKKDTFCWRCHRDGAVISCETCPRSFHPKCLKQSVTNPEHWPCPECVAILKAENTQTRSPAMKDITLEHLCGLLKFAVKRMIQCTGSEPFIHRVNEKEFPEYRNYVVQPMDLTRLEKNIKDNLYGSTQAFEADAKWILHNSIIFNSYQSKLTTIAKSIIKICKQEMAEIENCASCYLNANTKKNSWFVEVCPKPHIVLWAKLKGFPYWPAKAMSTNSAGMVDVRFFGAHDRAWVSFKECFLYSKRDPNSNKQKRNDINECIKELEVYIDNLKKVYAEFNYADYRVPFDPELETQQLQMLLPRYKSNVKWSPFTRADTEDSPRSPEEAANSESAGADVQRSPVSSSSHSTPGSKDDVFMEGYGTEDEDDSNDKCKVNSMYSRVGNESDSDSGESGPRFAVDSRNGSSDVEAQIEANVIVETRVRGKVRTRGGYTNTTGKLKILPRQVIYDSDNVPKRNSTEDVFESPRKLPRRNSDLSVKSDSSRLSSISDKINRVDILENMEVSLGNNAGNMSISENLTADPGESKRKPVVQLNVGANENKEFTISPQSKSSIADRLIRKLTESEDTVSLQETSKLEAVTKQLVNSVEDPGIECDPFLFKSKSDTDLLLEKYKTNLGSVEKYEEITSNTQIFESPRSLPDNLSTLGAEKAHNQAANVESFIEVLEVNPECTKSNSSSEISSSSDGDENVKSSAVEVLQAEEIGKNPPETAVLEKKSEISSQENIRLETGEEIDASQEEINVTDIRNIIHSSLNEINNVSLKPSGDAKTVESPEKILKAANADSAERERAQVESNLPAEPAPVVSGPQAIKRKRSNADSENLLQNKMIKLVNISAITDRIIMEQLDKPSDNMQKKEKPQSVGENKFPEIKNEPMSEEDDEFSEDEYMEAKRQYLSALNISEKVLEAEKPKQNEMRTRSKTEEQMCKYKVIDNLTKIIDSVASNYPAANQRAASEKAKEIHITPLSKLQMPKQRARKSFPGPTFVVPARSAHQSAKCGDPGKAMRPASTSANSLIAVNKSITVSSANLSKTIVTTSQSQVTSSLLFLSQPQPIVNSLAVLPPNQPITYTTSRGNSILTMVQHPISAGFSKVFVPQAPGVGSGRREQHESQNYIPQNDAATSSTVNNTQITSSNSFVPSSIPALAPLSNAATSNGNGGGSEICLEQNGPVEEQTILNGLIPENLSKAVSELMCRPPPRLKPRPPGVLSTNFQEGLPSSAGPVSSRINSISHRIGDYFRGMLVETLQELGNVENPEAVIASLRLENEELRYKHKEEVLEIKKNVNTILKDIQKSIEEEKTRLIDETRSACEAEAIKRVEEAKSKQWCANCAKEAQFYCCWNTSYCDYPCQQKHWPKHMSKCTQNTTSTCSAPPQTTLAPSPKSQGQIVFRQTTGKGMTKTLIAKPTKVYASKPPPINVVRGPATTSHLTLVESTPGNYELLGSGGPIAVGGKFLAATSIIGKIRTGNVLTVTSPSSSNVAGPSSGTKKVACRQPAISVVSGDESE